MNKEIKLTTGKLILIVTVIFGINIVGLSASANYAISANKVSYSDNSNLGTTDVQAAIDGTCTKFSDQLTNLTNNIMSKMYPVGSIYISTSISDVTTLESTIGVGTWEAYGKGKTLVGVDTANTLFNTVNKTGGSSSVTLTTSNLPSHSHTYTPSGTVSSKFTGKAVNTGNQSANHTHTFSGTTSTNGNHTHTISRILKGAAGNNITLLTASGNANTYDTVPSAAAGNHSHTYSGTTSGVSQNHTHSVTAAGTVASTFSGSSSKTGSVGSNASFSVQNPYITVYMYKRIS